MDRREFLAAGGVALGGMISSSLANPIASDASLKRIESGDLALIPKSTDCWELAPKRNGALKILQVTDTHFSSTAEKDQLSIKTLDTLIRQTDPDLILHTGDFVNNDSKDPVSWEGVDFFNKLKRPWTLCFGNHDYPVAGAKGSLALEDYRKSLTNCAMGYTEIDKKRHYCFRHDIKSRRDEPAMSLFYFQVGYAQGDRKISDPQLAWFDAQMKADQAKKWDNPILVFVHIPLIEHDSLAEKSKLEDGFKNERVCYDSDTGVSFKAFAASKRVRGVFCGHDHTNNYFGTWDGISLHYGRVSGWGGYGKWARGGRLITLDPASGRFSQREVVI